MYFMTVIISARIVQCLLRRDMIRGCLRTRNSFKSRTSFIIFRILMDLGTGRSSYGMTDNRSGKNHVRA